MGIIAKAQYKMPVAGHFTWEEMVDAIGRDVPAAAQAEIRRMVLQLETLRGLAGGTPITINSGYRDLQANTATGGATHSYHMTGQAVDISHGTLNPARLGALCKKLWKGVIIYPNHVHVDNRPSQYHALGVYA